MELLVLPFLVNFQMKNCELVIDKLTENRRHSVIKSLKSMNSTTSNTNFSTNTLKRYLTIYVFKKHGRSKN